MAEPDDSDIARVLRAAGGRAAPSDDAAQAVFQAVHAEWRATVERRKRQRNQRVWLALAASIAVAGVALFMGRSFLGNTPGERVADVSRSVGVVQIRGGNSDPWERVDGARVLHVGESIHTGADGRLALA